MNNENIKTTENLINFIEKSPTAFHAVDEITKILEENGFVKLSEGEKWNLTVGGKYCVTRNLSSIIAFAILSFTDPDGFKYSNFPRILLSNPNSSSIFVNSTRGVLPISCPIDVYIFAIMFLFSDCRSADLSILPKIDFHFCPQSEASAIFF